MSPFIRRPLFSVIALMSVTSAAFAGGNGDYGHQPTQPTGTTYNATVNNTALAGALANSRSSSASNSHSTSVSTSTATGGRSNARATGGNSSASNGGVVVNNSGSNGPRYTTPDTIAPSIVTANECALPRSFGVSAILAGASGGWANESENCKRQRMADHLDRIGEHTTARELRCLEDDMRRAAYSSGLPCARDARGWDQR